MRVGPTYRTFALLLAGALLSSDVHSQTTTSGGLAGVVIDQTGVGSNIDLETVQYGIIASASTVYRYGYEFTNLQLRAGGSDPPDVLINGGSVRGNWALGAFPIPQAGNLVHVNIIGSDLP
jgi:hypothetical protein